MTMLLDRPRAESSPEIVLRVTGDGRGGGGRRRSFLGMLFAGAVVVVVVMLIGQVSGLLSLDLFSSKTIDRSPPVLLKQISNLAEFHAAEGEFEALLDIEEDVPILPDFIAGSSVSFSAVGTVDATVDFSAIGGDAVQVASDGAVTITLPKPQLGDAVVDPRRSHVVDRDRGIADRIGGVFEDDPTGERGLYIKAGKRLDRAAAESHLVDRAERNTTRMLVSLLDRLGHDRVTVVFFDRGPLQAAAAGSKAAEQGAAVEAEKAEAARTAAEGTPTR